MNDMSFCKKIHSFFHWCLECIFGKNMEDFETHNTFTNPIHPSNFETYHIYSCKETI